MRGEATEKNKLNGSSASEKRLKGKEKGAKVTVMSK